MIQRKLTYKRLGGYPTGRTAEEMIDQPLKDGIHADWDLMNSQVVHDPASGWVVFFTWERRTV